MVSRELLEFIGYKWEDIGALDYIVYTHMLIHEYITLFMLKYHYRVLRGGGAGIWFFRFVFSIFEFWYLNSNIQNLKFAPLISFS